MNKGIKFYKDTNNNLNSYLGLKSIIDNKPHFIIVNDEEFKQTNYIIEKNR